MMFGGRFNKIEPKYIGDNTNNGVWDINEVYALKEAGVWPASTNSSKDIYFSTNKLLLTSRTTTISDLSILNNSLVITKFQKQIIDGPDNNPINAIYNDDYSNQGGTYASIVTGSNAELAINNQDYTIECWIKPIRRQANGYYTLFSTYKSGTDGAVFGFDNDGRIFADGGFGNWAFGNITNGINVSSGQWHHIAFVKSGIFLRCFVNGVQYGSTATTSKIHTATSVRIGNYDNQSFVGHLSEFRLTVGVARYTSAFVAPVIPFPNIEEPIAPLAPNLSADSLFGDASVELFWVNLFDGGSDITSFDIQHSISSDMSDPVNINAPIVAPVGPIDDDWNNVVLLLHGDGADLSTTFIDSGPNNLTNNIIAQGSPIISATQNKFGGSSLYFDGSSYLSFGSNTNWDFSSIDFTIEFWVYHTADGQYRGIIGARQNSTPSGWCLYIHPNNTIYMGSTIIGQGYSDRQLNTTTIPANTWTHIAFVKTFDGYRLYVNGQSGALLSFTNGLEYQSAQPLVIGALGSQGEYPFLGYLDEVRITRGLARYTSNFTVASTAFPDQGPATIFSSYTVTGLINDTSYYFRIRANNSIGNGIYSNIVGPITPSNIVPQRLIGGDFGLSTGSDPYEYNVVTLLHFDGSDGSTVFADSGGSSLYVSAAGDAQISTTQSVFGGASLLLDGTGDYLSLPITLESFNTGDFTIECWIYPTTWNNNAVILGGSSNNCLQFGRYGSNNLGIAKQGVTWYITNATLPPLNTWTHLAVTRKNNELKIWINGVQSGSTYNTSVDFSSPCNQIGAGGGSSFFAGYIDELRITNNIARYSSSFTVPNSAYPNATRGQSYSNVTYAQDDAWYTTSTADKVFDNNLMDNNNNQWKSPSLNRAFGIDFGKTQKIDRYLMWRNTNNQNSPTNWLLQGSNTQSDWDNLPNNAGNSIFGTWQTIDTRTNVYLPKVVSSSPASNPFGLFVVSNPGAYRYYRLFVSGARADGPGSEASRAWVTEMQMIGPISAPDTPTALSVIPLNNSASLSWSYTGALLYYTIEWSSDGGSTILDSTITTNSLYTITGLVNGNSYVFRVKATNTAGESSFTAWSDPVVPAFSAFGPAVSFTKSNYGSEVDVIIPGSLSITRGNNQGIYNPAAGETGWNYTASPANTVWVADWNNFCGLSTRNDWTSFQEILQYRIGNNVLGAPLVMKHTPTNRYWKIDFTSWTQGNAGGGFAYTRQEFLECDNSAPSSAPVLDSVYTESTTSLDVYWTALSSASINTIPAVGYVVEWSTDNATWTASSTLSGAPGATISYTINGLTTGVQYNVRVKAVNSVGSGPYSTTLTGTPGTATGFGPTLTVTEADYNNPSIIDYVVPGAIHLTRNSQQGLYNAYNQSGWDGNGPSDTEWTLSWTNECDLSSRSWSSFYMIWGGGGIGSNIVNSELIMRQISTGKMWFIKFSVWNNQYSGAGYTYTRKRFYGC